MVIQDPNMGNLGLLRDQQPASFLTSSIVKVLALVMTLPNVDWWWRVTLVDAGLPPCTIR